MKRASIHQGIVVAMLLAAIAGCSTERLTTQDQPGQAHGFPITFTLPKDALVTLVVDDETGNRVRNLVAERPYKAGRHTIVWDGLDESGSPARPGRHRWRGLYRDPIHLAYQFSVYEGGASLPWFHPNTRPPSATGWLSDHNPPVSACAAGEKIFLGAVTSENGHDIMAVDLDGRKLWGRSHLGAVGAAALAWDGRNVYVAGEGQWAGANAYVFRLDPTSYKHEQVWTTKGYVGIRGMAARDGKVYLASDTRGKILVLDLAGKKIAKQIPLARPGGIAFDAKGRLLAIRGKTVVVVDEAGKHQPLVTANLTRPNRLAVSPDGTIFVTDGPTSWYPNSNAEHNALYGTEDVRFAGDHQVKVFDAEGKFLRAIGTPGGRTIGPYDPRAMRCPVGVAVDARGRVWVAEWDMLPKRVSVWTPEGKLVREFLGAHKYGGGGALDAGDRTQMLYDGMLFKLDWARGTWRLDATIVDVMNVDAKARHTFGGYADWPTQILRYKGREYFIGGGHFWSSGGGSVWVRSGRSFRPVAYIGPFQPGEHADIVQGRPDKSHFLYRRMVECVGEAPPGAKADDVGGPPGKWNGFISWPMAWADANADGVIQPREVNFSNKLHHWLTEATIGPDFSAYLRMPSHRGVTTLWRVPLAGINKAGAPVWDFEKIETVLEKVLVGWPDVAADAAGRIVLNGKPICGYDTKAKTRWTYRNDWPKHGTGAPRWKPGLVVAAYSIRGTADVGGQVGTVVAINSNYGQWYLFTTDGLFLATIFGDCRTAPFWGGKFPQARRGMRVDGASLGQESFAGWFGRTSDGNVYCVAGHPHCSVIQVTGLDSVRRIEGAVTVPAKKLADAAAARAAEQRKTAGPPQTGFWPHARVLSGKYHPGHSVALAAERLYRVWLSFDKDKLWVRAQLPHMVNKGEDIRRLFATGDAAVVELGLDAKADPARTEPAPGDVRIVLTVFKGKPTAVLYRYKTGGAATPAVFTSPAGKVAIDEIAAIAGAEIKIEPFETNSGMGVEVTAGIPWRAVAEAPPRLTAGASLRGDVGIILGDAKGAGVARRVYWASRPAELAGDVGLEARLLPQFWGLLKVEK